MLRVVVNPGHHALTDRGATGPSGLREAEVVREVTLALCPLAGGEIVYEPKRQGAAGLWSLTWALRRNPPDVLISLHTDAGAAELHQARAVYWRDDIRRDRAERSLLLAETIRAHAEGSFAEDARVMEAPYLRERRDGTLYEFTPGILKRTATGAAVLVELGFISDRHVEAEMRKPEWVARAAVSLDLALRHWARNTGRPT